MAALPKGQQRGCDRPVPLVPGVQETERGALHAIALLQAPWIARTLELGCKALELHLSPAGNETAVQAAAHLFLLGWARSPQGRLPGWRSPLVALQGRYRQDHLQAGFAWQEGPQKREHIVPLWMAQSLLAQAQGHLHAAAYGASSWRTLLIRQPRLLPQLHRPAHKARLQPLLHVHAALARSVPWLAQQPCPIPRALQPGLMPHCLYPTSCCLLCLYAPSNPPACWPRGPRSLMAVRGQLRVPSIPCQGRSQPACCSAWDRLAAELLQQILRPQLVHG